MRMATVVRSAIANSTLTSPDRSRSFVLVKASRSAWPVMPMPPHLIRGKSPASTDFAVPPSA
jgi:hypothetical protein